MWSCAAVVFWTTPANGNASFGLRPPIGIGKGLGCFLNARNHVTLPLEKGKGVYSPLFSRAYCSTHVRLAGAWGRKQRSCGRHVRSVPAAVSRSCPATRKPQLEWTPTPGSVPSTPCRSQRKKSLFSLRDYVDKDPARMGV